MSVIKGTDGKVSATRFSTVVVVLTIMVAFLSHNIAAIAHGSEKFISIGFNEFLLLTTALGSKVAQHFSESKGKTVSTDAEAAQGK